MTVPQPSSRSADRPFTLVRALGWLGHRCVACSGTEGLLRAPVWFIRHGGSAAATTLVVVDLTDARLPSSRSSQLLQAVNDCVRHDRILVCEWRHVVMGRAQAAFNGSAVADVPPAGGCHRFDATALHPDRS